MINETNYMDYWHDALTEDDRRYFLSTLPDNFPIKTFDLDPVTLSQFIEYLNDFFGQEVGEPEGALANV